MAFITTESGICLSPTGETVYPTCGDLITEPSEPQYIQDEESSRNLMIDGACGDSAIPAFYCDIERKTVDGGKFVTLINTCTLPFTITGFRNSDPTRFSIFSAENFNSIYSSGNTPQLPFTLDPYKSINIPTFFHPLRSELETGTAGTYDNMIGDKFGARIDIYPGVPILNCSTDELSCDSFFQLSGQLVCDNIDTPDFLSNDENFIVPNIETLTTIQSQNCLTRTPVMGYNIPNDTSSDKNTLSGLSGASEYFPAFLGNNWLDTYQDMGYSGALGTFYKIVTDVMRNYGYPTMPILLSQSIDDYRVQNTPAASSLAVSGSYRSNNYTTLDVDGYTYTGMRFELVPGENTPLPLNCTVFFNVTMDPGPPDDVRMFIVQSGDYGANPICVVD